MDFHSPQQEGLNVMESWSGRDQEYQGLDNMLYSNGAECPNHLRIGHQTRSDLDLHINYSDRSNSDSSNYETQQNLVVYISYTDRKAEWVQDYLKPLIESWNNSEVILHEEDMIPGFTISGERQRLILQANKVVMVVSGDYSESPWCLYELQHAIHQEPDLFLGRIIPVMVDGCQTLPTIVRGIVPLLDSDRNFKLKLKKNIVGGV